MRSAKNLALTGVKAFFGIAMAGFFVAASFNAEKVFATENEPYTAMLTTSSSGGISIDIASGPNDATAIYKDTITATTNCTNGYTLGIGTSASSANLYRLVDGSATGSPVITPVDGTTLGENTWGYTISYDPTNSENDIRGGYFYGLPRKTDEAATLTTINDNTQTALDVYYGVKISDGATPGTYKMADNGTIIYYMTMSANCASYDVIFNANGGSGTMADQMIQAGEATKLSANAFTAPTTDSYTDADNTTITGTSGKLWTFWGWNTEANGSGDWYKNMEEVTDLMTLGTSLNGARGTITLYAQWKQATLADMTTPTTETTGTKSITNNTMQDMSPEICYNSAINTVSDAPGATLNDSRGKTSESYTVSKLPDGLCWMTKTLNLGSDADLSLTPDDTDITANFTLPASSSIYSTANNNINTPYNLYNHTIATYTVNNVSHTTDVASYYTYAAATADTETYSKTTNGIYPTTSICPKNWDLPTEVQFTNLRTKGSITSAATAFNALYNYAYGGYRSGASSFTNETSTGYYWTSRNNGASVAYWTYVNSSGLYSSTTTGNKYYGAMIRCVASQGTVTINYDGNGSSEYPVSGTVQSQENVEINTAFTQSTSGFIRNGWEPNGWNTAADGSGTAVAGDVALSTLVSTLDLKPGSTITLYAQWLPQYKITYVNNCYSFSTGCTEAVSNGTRLQNITLNGNPGTGTGSLAGYSQFSFTGWKIKEWTTNADGSGTAYPLSSSYTTPANSGPGDGITLYAHWVPIYTVQYDGNGSDNDATGMGSTNASTGIKTVAHTNVGEGDTFDLFASNFKKSGYGFVGWSTDSDAWSKLTDNDTTNDAKIWGPNEVITAPAYNGTPITTLYAVWAPAETNGSNPVYLQGWTGCSDMTATTYNSTTGKLTVAKDSITALTDERDGNVYAIAKLADENCWMIENLRLADTHNENGNSVDTTLSTSNTNIVSTSSTLPITNIYNADSSLATKSNKLSPSSNAAYNASTAPYGWCTTNSAACDDQSRLRTDNTTANVTPTQNQNMNGASANAHTNFNNSIYAYGNYYNWYSATAGYGTYSRTTNKPTDGDLCPAGWKLPYGNSGISGDTNIGGTKGGFYYLADKMGATVSSQVNSNKFRMFPNNFLYSGYVYGSNIYNRGSNGYYWSSSAYYSYYAYTLYLDSSSLSPGTYNYNKLYGFTVRCVAGS